MPTKLKNKVKTGNYTSIKKLIRNWKKQKLIKELKKSKKELEAGKGIILKSLNDLR